MTGLLSSRPSPLSRCRRLLLLSLAAVAVALAATSTVGGRVVDAPNAACSTDGGRTYFSSDFQQCTAVGGLPIGVNCIQQAPQVGRPGAGPPQQPPGLADRLRAAKAANGWIFFTQTDPAGAQAGWLQTLLNKIRLSGILNKDWGAFYGQPGRPYTPTTYDCDDFATDFQLIFGGLGGYDTTFTVYWCAPPFTYPRSAGHAVNDVHAPDGTVAFIDPQSGQQINLDFDGDGVVGAGTTNRPFDPATGAWRTDDNCRIETYTSRQAAEAAGVVMD